MLATTSFILITKGVQKRNPRKECISNSILLPNLFLPTVRKKFSSDREQLLKFEAEGQEFAKFLRIIGTIHSNSERSEQFLVTECVFNLCLEVTQI
jgi:hypothetical protein